MKKLTLLLLLLAMGCQQPSEQVRSQSKDSLTYPSGKTACEELLVALDSDYGADCRQPALQKFNELAAQGKVPKRNPVMATLIMVQCYQEAKAKLVVPEQSKYKSGINIEYFNQLFGQQQDAGPNEPAPPLYIPEMFVSPYEPLYSDDYEYDSQLDEIEERQRAIQSQMWQDQRRNEDVLRQIQHQQRWMEMQQFQQRSLDEFHRMSAIPDDGPYWP